MSEEDKKKEEIERPQEWHSVTEVTPEMLDKDKTEPDAEEVWEDEGGAIAEEPEEVASGSVQEPDAAAVVSEPDEEPVAETVVSELPDEAPTEEDRTAAKVANTVQPESTQQEANVEKLMDEVESNVASAEWTVTDKVDEMVFSSGGAQPFADVEDDEPEVVEDKDILKDEGELIYASGGEQPFTATPVIANVEPKIVDALPDDDEVPSSDKEVTEYLVKSYKWILTLLGMIIAVIIAYNAWLGPYEIKPNFAPETAPYERTPGEITRDSLDPMTHFPRKPEVIRKEQYERHWNEMNLFERMWWWFFGDSPRDDY